MRALTGLALAAAVAAHALPAAAEVPPAVIARVAQSLVKVIAVCGAGGDARIGSGFVFGPERQIVTDLHVVVGCPTVSVLYFVPGPDGRLTQVLRATQVVRTLREADLALLDPSQAPAVPALALAKESPKPEDDLVAVGFPLGVQAPIDTPLRVTFANDLFPELDATLDDAARADLERTSFPSLTVEVLHLNGALQPGDSGAPVVNAAGELVGIGSGGLARGAASISWAMRAKYLPDLLAARDSAPLKAPEAATLFAEIVRPLAAGIPAPPPQKTCGLTLTQRGTRPYAALTKNAAAEPATQRIQALAPDAVKPDTPFDIWTDAVSGIALVVPAGTELAAAADGWCAARLDPHVRILVHGAPMPFDPEGPEWRLAWWHFNHTVFGRYETELARHVPLHPDAAYAPPEWSVAKDYGAVQVRRFARRTSDRQASFYSGAVFARGAGAVVAALLDQPEASAGPQTRAALARAVAAISVSSYAPPDRAGGGPPLLPTKDDGLSSGDEPLPTELSRTEPFEHIACPGNFLLTSQPATFASLAAGTTGSRPAVSGAVLAASGASAGTIANAQYDVWASLFSSAAVLVPRGVRPVQLRRPDGKILGCRFGDLAPGGFLVGALLSRHGRPLDDVPAARAGIGKVLGAELGTFQPSDDPAPTPDSRLWHTTATIDAKTFPWRVPVSMDGKTFPVIVRAQAYEGLHTRYWVVFAVGYVGDPHPSRRWATAVGGALLAPAATAELSR
jgi:S1-C subfamily serine protease